MILSDHSIKEGIAQGRIWHWFAIPWRINCTSESDTYE